MNPSNVICSTLIADQGGAKMGKREAILIEPTTIITIPDRLRFTVLINQEGYSTVQDLSKLY